MAKYGGMVWGRGSFRLTMQWSLNLAKQEAFLVGDVDLLGGGVRNSGSVDPECFLGQDWCWHWTLPT